MMFLNSCYPLGTFCATPSSPSCTGPLNTPPDPGPDQPYKRLCLLPPAVWDHQPGTDSCPASSPGHPAPHGALTPSQPGARHGPSAEPPVRAIPPGTCPHRAGRRPREGRDRGRPMPCLSRLLGRPASGDSPWNRSRSPPCVPRPSWNRSQSSAPASGPAPSRRSGPAHPVMAVT